VLAPLKVTVLIVEVPLLNVELLDLGAAET